MRNFINLLIIFICYIQILFPKNYIWPTNSSDKLSATFGEYRSGHYHAGIDVKTNNTIGHPCYAIEDGYISRLVTKPYGYGKAVYLKLYDGNIAVYAHLDGFNTVLDSIIRYEQNRLGKYTMTKYLKKDVVPVKKGDIIAYTGCTGTRYPHLHFEIRDRNHNPVDPLKFKCYSIKDNTPPLINKIAIIPVSPKTMINNNPGNYIFIPHQVEPGKYRFKKPIIVKGEFAVEISTNDIVRGLWNKYGTANIKLFHDDSLIFEQKMDKFSYSKTRLIEIDRNYQLISEGEGRFIRMWKYAENLKAPFHKTRNNGIIKPGKDESKLRLEVFDFNKNKTTLDLKILHETIETPEIIEFSQDSINYKFSLKRDSLNYLYSSINLAWVDSNGNSAKVAKMSGFSRNDSSYNFSTVKHENAIIRITGISAKAKQKLICYYNPMEKSKSQKADVKYIHNAKTFVAKIKFSNAPKAFPELYLHSPKDFYRVKLQALSPIEYVTTGNSMYNWGMAHTLEIRANNEILYRRPIDFHLITPKTDTVQDYDNITLKYSKGMVYDTLLTKSVIDSSDSNIYFEYLSNAVRIFPDNQALKGSAKLTIGYNDIDDIEKLAIYSVAGKRAWYVGAKKDRINKTISAKINNFSNYVLLKDTIPPTIKKIFPADGKYYKNSSIKVIRAAIDDSLSRLNGEKGIIVKLNGEKVIAEWHPIFKTIKYKPEERLAKGSHTLQISVEDKAGNINSKTIKFHIVD